MDLGLSGEVALVTGGSREIGRATALTRARGLRGGNLRLGEGANLEDRAEGVLLRCLG